MEHVMNLLSRKRKNDIERKHIIEKKNTFPLTRKGPKHIISKSFERRKQTFEIFSLFFDRYFLDC